jgi:hypothetical protein
MAQQYIHTDIKRSCFEDQFFKADVLFDDHLLVWLISGETRIVQADKTYHHWRGRHLVVSAPFAGHRN